LRAKRGGKKSDKENLLTKGRGKKKGTTTVRSGRMGGKKKGT